MGLGAAIAYFTKNEQTISIPLTDSQKYDLVVDFGDNLRKVQVKTSTFQRYGRFEVHLNVMTPSWKH